MQDAAFPNNCLQIRSPTTLQADGAGGGGQRGSPPTCTQEPGGIRGSLIPALRRWGTRLAQWGGQSQAAPSSSAQLGGERPPAWSASEWAAKGVPPGTRHSGNPTKAALALQTANTGRQARSTCFAGCFRSPARPAAPHPPRVGLGLPSVHPQPLGKGSPSSLPRHGLGGRHPSGFLAPKREVAYCPPAMQTGSPVRPRHGWKGSPDTAHTTHPLPMAYERLAQFREIPVLPRPEGKKPKKTKESILPKQRLHKSLRFSFFLEVV